MNISLIPLNTKGRVDLDFNADFSKYKSADIVRTEDIRVSGFIIDNGTDEYEISLHIEGTAVVRSARNLSEVEVPLDIKIDEFIENLVSIYKNSSNSLDILPIIWENILLEIPIRSLNAGDEFASTRGEGWEVSEEDE